MSSSIESMPLPDFVIIGTQKGGTTSLSDYLARHPDVRPPRQKEVHYFDENYGRGINWYSQFFATGDHSTGTTFESSPYYMAHPLVPRRMAEDLENPKLVVLLRNPVDRAYSHYQHQVRKGREELSFEEAIDAEPDRVQPPEEAMASGDLHYSEDHRIYSYLLRGMYARQLNRWFEYFDRGHFHVMQSERFFEDTSKTYRDLLGFFDLAEHEPDEYQQVSAGDYDPMDDETRRQLEEFFEPHNQKLYELLDREFDW